jgi:hypothetical protein
MMVRLLNKKMGGGGYWGLCASVKPKYGKMMLVRLLIKKMGGVLPNKKRKTSAKFVQEARGCFGVAMRRNYEGYDGVRAAPFDYSGHTVIGVKNFVSRCNEEMRRVKQLKGRWGQSGEGYPNHHH